jgi:hypothetical protein
MIDEPTPPTTAGKYTGLPLIVANWAVAVWFLAGAIASLLARNSRFGLAWGLIFGALVLVRAIQMTRDRQAARRSSVGGAKPTLGSLIVYWLCAVLFLGSSLARLSSREPGFDFGADLALGVVLLVCVIQMTRDRLSPF